uniref:NADH-ubiquinone oxidoreductase chain 6 n=1 Tax=Zelandoperla fenestrata TaxID=670197 RepID=A0A1X9ZF29_9NEOP|nr:NADH dehydrogenase subunit 6 [Zelandoperla fenestrata]ARS43781.1 NADH dehydrogenase subunit 6 [Zelandoperla fenestrata]
MYQSIIMIVGMLSSITFTQMNHPLAMGLMLLVQTLIICLATGMMAKSFWFSYILFLVFLGGLLVLFIYVTSLASNEMFSLSTKIIVFISGPLVLLTLLSMSTDMLITLTNYLNSDMITLQSSFMYQEEATQTLLKLYNAPTSIITLMLVAYLFLTLIAVVSITNIFNGPLREKN